MTRKTTNGDGGEIVAMDLPWDTSPAVLDLTAHKVVKTETITTTEKEEPMGEQPYEKFLRENAEAETTATYMNEDRLYEQFAEQSGMNDMLGRTPQAGTADLSALSEAGESVETSADTDMSDRAMWSAFVAATGFEDTAPASPAVAADLSEDGDDVDDAGISDEEAWAQYQAVIGQGQ